MRLISENTLGFATLNSFLTGRQHGVLWPEEPKGLYANMTLMPEHLRNLGYDTHIVGKWHLGFCNESYLPTRFLSTTNK